MTKTREELMAEVAALQKAIEEIKAAEAENVSVICEHGNRLTVHLETVSSICWDDGIWMYDKNNRRAHSGDYLEVSGCAYCSLIKVVED
jgi:hypothetical protein